MRILDEIEKHRKLKTYFEIKEPLGKFRMIKKQENIFDLNREIAWNKRISNGFLWSTKIGGHARFKNSDF